MATKIRLQRHGRKQRAFYHIVVADQRAPRDGRFIEKLGTYNPNTNPATIDISMERALHWVMVGAQPTDTANAILSYKGVNYKKHLQVGVNKGALTQEEADKKFAAWMEEKAARIEKKKSNLADAASKAKAAAMQAETSRKEATAAKILAKAAAAIAEAEQSEASEEAAEEVAAETSEETAAEEAPAAEEGEAAAE